MSRYRPAVTYDAIVVGLGVMGAATLAELAARGRTVRNAIGYLKTAAEGLLDVARRDLSELDAWKNLVHAGRSGFEDRYRREFLAGESFHRFDRTREQVLEMLEFSGPGRFLSAFAGFALP